jgi:dihydroneopterin aldolase
MEKMVSEWVAKNEKTINKKLCHQVVQLLMEEFPDLRYVEAKDYAFRIAKGHR